MKLHQRRQPFLQIVVVHHLRLHQNLLFQQNQNLQQEHLYHQLQRLDLHKKIHLYRQLFDSCLHHSFLG